MRHLLAAAALLLASSAFAAGKEADKPSPAGTIQIKVTAGGFEPEEVKVKKGQPTTLVFTRVAEKTCMKAIDIPDEGVKKLDLPLNQPVSVTITPKKAGVEAFHCSAMGMGNGRIVVE